MRNLEIYTFKEKTPTFGKKLIIIPSQNDRDNAAFYVGRLVDNREVWKEFIAKEDDPDKIKDLEDRLQRIIDEDRYLVIEWDDDDDIADTPINKIPDWEWMEIERND